MAAGQSWVFSLTQLAAAGGDRQLAARRLRSGRWVRLGPRTFGFAGTPDTWIRKLWVAHLDMGLTSHVSYAAAAGLASMPSFPKKPVEITVAHGSYHRSTNTKVVVHQTRNPWPPRWITRIDGLPVSDRAATLVDLAADKRIHTERIFQVSEQLVIDGLISANQLSARLHHVGHTGRAGVERMEKLVDRLIGTSIHGSILEARLAAMLAAAGDPPLVPQFAVPWRPDRDAIADFGDPDVTASFELDGRTWHDRRAQQLKDRQRDQQAARAGWLPTRFLAEQLDSEPEHVLATIRDIRRQRAGMVWHRPAS